MHIQRRADRRSAAARTSPASRSCSAARRCRRAPSTIPNSIICISARSAMRRARCSRMLGRDCARPATQVRLETASGCRSTDFPIPAYELVELRRYFLGSVQFSSGCPYQLRILRHSRALRPGAAPQDAGADHRRTRQDAGLRRHGSVYFVDDNFIGNRRAVRELLPHLVAWQKRNRLPVSVRLRGDAQHRQVRRTCWR